MQALKLETMSKVDEGRWRTAINNELDEMFNDCRRRATDDRERTVTITIGAKPVYDADESCCVEFVTNMRVRAKCPPRQSKPTVMKAGSDGQVYFEEELTVEP